MNNVISFHRALITRMYLPVFLMGMFFLLWGSKLQAQSYGTIAGLRLGNNDFGRTVGLTGKYRIEKGLTLEGIVQSDFSYNTTGHFLIEKHKRLISKRFNYYYGTGLSAGLEESRFKNPETMEIISTYGNPTMGVDLIVGVEVTLLKTNISIDYKPNVNLVGREEWFRGQVGISVRTVIVKGSTQNKKKRQKRREKNRNENTGYFKNIIQKIKK